jgi:hypothetical protein
VPGPEPRIHEGRPVSNRAELMRQVGISQSAAEAWYRDRATNGHPEPVLTVGRRLFFDEETALGWAHSRLDQTDPPPRITRTGRTLITRAEIGQLSKPWRGCTRGTRRTDTPTQPTRSGVRPGQCRCADRVDSRSPQSPVPGGATHSVG